MKTKLTFLLAALVSFHALAADDLTAVLQQALFNEEADHDLAAAIKAYQFVVAGADAQRKLAATAVFRLGECYRKLGQTNEAVAQYQRVVRDFSDQTNLVTLSRQNLAGLGANTEHPRGRGMMGLTFNELLQLQADAGPAGRTDGGDASSALRQNLSPAARAQLKELLQGEIAVASQLLGEQRKKEQAGAISVAETWRFERDVLGLNRQLLAVDGLPTSEDRKRWREMLVEEIALAEKAAQNERTKLDAGKSIASELAKLQRDVFALKRELLTFDAAPASSSAVGAPRETAATDEEDKEVRRIQAIIRDSPDLINAPKDSQMPLHSAASKGQLVVARFLLDNGANVNAARTDSGETALILAASQGHKSMVEFLLSRGADPNAKKEYGETALHRAARYGYGAVAEVLLANKADVNSRSVRSETPLHVAVSSAQRAMMEALLERGADVNARDKDGDPPLEYAVALGNTNLIDLLLQRGADINATNNMGAPPLWAALEKEKLDAVRQLLERGANLQFTVRKSSPVHSAVNHKSPGMLKLLIEHKAAVNVRDGEGLTPLQRAVMADTKPELVSLLVQAGADLNAVFDPSYQPLSVTFHANLSKNTRGEQRVQLRGYPPLLLAVLRENTALVEALLIGGAHVNDRSPEDKTALMYSAERGSMPIAETLLKFKPDTELSDPEGATPLLRAAWNQDGPMVEALIKAGANVNATYKSSWTGWWTAGWTALHSAAWNGSPEVAGLLLRAGADPNAHAPDGSLPLGFTRNKQSFPGGTTPARREEVAKLLLQHGADESLLRRRNITVTRRSRNHEQVVFRKGTNDFNRHTLYELMAGVYAPGRPRSEDQMFPDLRRIAIERTQNGSGTRQILVDLEARAADGACTNDLWLEWGDRLEIRETEHSLNANWPGLDGTLATNISRCLGRTVNLVIKGSTNRIELRASASFADQTVGPAGGHLNGYHINQESFWLAEVLRRSGLLLTTSDLARVRVRRRDPTTGQPQEWIIDETKPDRETDLWLRDGDVIEVPEK